MTIKDYFLTAFSTACQQLTQALLPHKGQLFLRQETNDTGFDHQQLAELIVSQRIQEDDYGLALGLSFRKERSAEGYLIIVDLTRGDGPIVAGQEFWVDDPESCIDQALEIAITQCLADMTNALLTTLHTDYGINHA